MLKVRTRRVVRACYLGATVVCLAGAGLSGLLFEESRMDMVLMQLVFLGGWSCLVGARLGGYAGAAMEEDCCSELDMGVLSSMGSLIGTLSTGLIGTALAGIGLLHSWEVVWALAVGMALTHAWLERRSTFQIVRRPHLDERGALLDDQGQPLPEEEQPLRMRDRLTVLLAVGFLLVLALTLVMARMMGGRDLGHSVMMAPMMYGMFGTMLGGMLGGWLAGLLDEHRGHPDHDNPVMISAMALMAGMMGGMPSGMIGGMMAIMGDTAIAVTIAAGLLLPLLSWWWVMRGRYRIERVVGEVSERPPLPSRRPTPAAAGRVAGETRLRVRGMSCSACVGKVERALGSLSGVHGIDVDLESGLVRVRWGDEFVGPSALVEGVTAAGYEVEAST